MTCCQSWREVLQSRYEQKLSEGTGPYNPEARQKNAAGAVAQLLRPLLQLGAGISHTVFRRDAAVVQPQYLSEGGI